MLPDTENFEGTGTSKTALFSGAFTTKFAFDNVGHEGRFVNPDCFDTVTLYVPGYSCVEKVNGSLGALHEGTVVVALNFESVVWTKSICARGVLEHWVTDGAAPFTVTLPETA